MRLFFTLAFRSAEPGLERVGAETFVSLRAFWPIPFENGWLRLGGVSNLGPCSETLILAEFCG
jgi:hypothetical protein